MVRVLREACSGQKHCGATPQVVWQLWCYLAEIFGTTISFWMWHRLGVLKLAIFFRYVWEDFVRIWIWKLGFS